MAEDLTFNTPENQTIARDMLILYLNTATSTPDESPEWSVVGYRIEDASSEYDWQSETKKDITGRTYTTLKTPTITQSFDTWELDAADKAQLRIWNLGIKEQNAQTLAGMDMLIAHAYAGTASSAVFCERYKSCAVIPTGIGGEGGGNLSFNVEVTFGGERITGTGNIADGTITFTPDEAA